jgi:hypothetical protein
VKGPASAVRMSSNLCRVCDKETGKWKLETGERPNFGIAYEQ